jgi:hypothetical protein
MNIFCCVVIVLFFSCKSVNNVRDPYNNLNILNYGDYTAYEFMNKKSDKFISQ